MRHAVLVLLAIAVAPGCDKFILDGNSYGDCSAFGADEWTWLVDNPEHCGACGNACPAGVPCVGTACRLDSVMHCGAADRRCFAAGERPHEVACREFADGDEPEGIALVDGFGCVPVEAPRVDVGPGDGEGVAKSGDGRWLTIPGHTAACADGLDTNGCVVGAVTYVDACEQPITEQLPYDFAIMTEEMTRGQFRELMCDCDEPKFGQCVRLCGEREAANAEALAARPMTGLNWCEAYTACQRLDARLPVLRERAMLEALAGESPTLFEAPLSCESWAAETGRVLWLAECLNRSPGELALDDVKGTAGQVFISGGALSEPESIHHLAGNVAEWLADRVGEVTGAGPAWSLPVGAEITQPRLVRGRSLFSPAGQPGAQVIAVEPSVKAEDLGVRCARTLASPFNESVPYDPAIPADDFAVCDEEPTGLRPVRQSVGEQVSRAVGICIDSEREMPTEFREKLLQRGLEFIVDGRYLGPLARRAIGGQLMEIGPARFAMDEQWWLVEPVRQKGERTEFRAGDIPVWLAWQGEETPLTSTCMEMAGTDPASADAYGRLVRRYPFVLDRADVWLLRRFDAADACAYLDCVQPDLSADACASECPGWVLPYAIEFRRVEPAGDATYCR